MRYDVIVVGARCGGSPTAMLLARAGLRVLLLDRASFPSDTISGHFIKPAGVSRLERWGLAEAVERSGCPAMRSFVLDFGGSESAVDLPLQAPSMLAPRRVVLDDLLIGAARAAGAEMRERISVTGLLGDDGRITGIKGVTTVGTMIREEARFVVGADGRGSHVARWAGAPQYHTHPTVSLAYYAYWSGFPARAPELHFRERRVVGLLPTNGNETLIFTQWPIAEATAFRRDIETSYLGSLAGVPSVKERLADARKASRLVGMLALPGFFRQAFGPGWALVGDAGHHKDPLVARGISDAFRDAELLSTALVRIFGGTDENTALAEYQRLRDLASVPVADLNAELARLNMPMEATMRLWQQLEDAELIADTAVQN